MKTLNELSIHRQLSEDTRKQGVIIGGEVYSMHITGSEVILTDFTDYSKIYSVQSIGLYQRIESENLDSST